MPVYRNLELSLSGVEDTAKIRYLWSSGQRSNARRTSNGESVHLGRGEEKKCGAVASGKRRVEAKAEVGFPTVMWE